MEGKSSREEFQPEGAEDVEKREEQEGSEKQEMRERWVQGRLYLSPALVQQVINEVRGPVVFESSFSCLLSYVML